MLKKIEHYLTINIILKELKMKHDNLENVSRKVVEETTVLHQRYKKEKEHGEKIQNDANKVRRWCEMEVEFLF